MKLRTPRSHQASQKARTPAVHEQTALARAGCGLRSSSRLRQLAASAPRNQISARAAAAADVERASPPRPLQPQGEEAVAAAPELPTSENGDLESRDHNGASTPDDTAHKGGRQHGSKDAKKQQFVWSGASGPHEPGRKRGPVKDFPFRVGDKVVGKVVGGWHGWRVALEWDSNILGFVLPIELPHVLREDVSEPKWGGTKYGLVREFTIKNIPDDMQYNAVGPLLSARSLDRDVIWQRAGQIMSVCQDDGESLEVMVRTTNRGGILGSFEGLAVFVPYSFIPNIGPGRGSREEKAQALIGERALLSICDMDRKRNRFVGNMIKGMADKAYLSLRVGDVVWGTAHDVVHYGVFVTLDDHPSIRGLLHIASISRSRVEQVTDVFHEGERVRCIISGIDTEKHRLNLSTAEIEPEDGDMLFNKAAVYEHAEANAEDFRRWVREKQEKYEPQDNEDQLDDQLEWNA